METLINVDIIALCFRRCHARKVVAKLGCSPLLDRRSRMYFPRKSLTFSLSTRCYGNGRKVSPEGSRLSFEYLGKHQDDNEEVHESKERCLDCRMMCRRLRVPVRLHSVKHTEAWAMSQMKSKPTEMIRLRRTNFM